MTPAEKYYVVTDDTGWSTVHGGKELELWRYRWEADERAEELNRKEGASPYSCQGGRSK